MPATRRLECSRDLRDLLSFQDGAATRAQLLACGCTDSWVRARIDSGRWQRAYPGVIIAASGEPSYNARVWAAILYAGPGAHACHETAAHLAELTDKQPRDIHVMVPASRHHRARRGLVLHRTRQIARRPIAGLPPRSRVEDIVLDLADGARSDSGVVAIVTAAMQRRKTSPSALRRALAQRPKIRHRALLEALFADEAKGIHSVLEWRYYTKVERAHGLPGAQRQQRVKLNGKRVFRDVPYVEYGVVVELDGRLWHAETAFRDMARDNATAERGEVSLRYGLVAVDADACGVARQVGTVLQRRGWTGQLTACGPHCTAIGLDRGA